MRKLAVGNWKMNGTGDDLGEVRALIAAHPRTRQTDIVICPPATLLHRLSDAVAGSSVATGGQDCHMRPAGAHTGDISAAMLREAGADYVILGHSERRTDHGETDAMVRAKATAAAAALLVPIICVGETQAQRAAGRTLEVIAAQLAGSLLGLDTGRLAPDAPVIAYEPVWAIGTGLTPTPEEIAEVHAHLRALTRRPKDHGLQDHGPRYRILYGGSVKPSNAAAIFAIPEVDGALVGGASLTAAEFGRIVAALDAA